MSWKDQDRGDQDRAVTPEQEGPELKGVLAWFANNSVAANLVMLIILVGGVVTSFNIRQEVFPEFSPDLITVTVPYLGAAPEEAEAGVCTRIEEQVQALETVKTLTSTAVEGQCVVSIELLDGANVRETLDDVKNRVDAIETFPEETEKPLIQEVIVKRQVISIAVAGDTDERSLKRQAEIVRDEVSNIPGITQVELAAARPYEISIEVSEDDLRRYGLTFDHVARAVRSSSLDLPGGSLRTEGGEILLRTKGQAYRQREFEEIVLLTRPDGSRLTLGEVATVVDGFAETDQASRFDGQSAVLVNVFRVGDQNVTEVSDKVHAYVADARTRMPAGIYLTTWQDDTELLRSRLDTLIRNGRTGLLLVLIVLALFMRLTLAIWVSVGIVVSFSGALWLMPTFDLSINVISLFAFIVVLGIVVDDAIVVGENIFRHYEMGKEGLRAAVDGVQEVAMPVTFSILTTVAAFGPLVLVPGSTGRIMRVIPLVVITTIFFSLVESLFVLPAHLSHLKHKTRKKKGLWQTIQGTVSGGLEWVITRAYRPTLARALEHRYTTLSIAVGILLISLGMIFGGRLQSSFFPPVPANNLVAFLTMPQGTTPEVTAAALARIEASAMALRQELESEGKTEVFRHVQTTLGEQPFQQAQSRHNYRPSVAASHIGEVNVELVPAENRSEDAFDLTRRWRELTGSIPGAVELTFQSTLFSTGDAVNIQLAGPHLDQLAQAADELQEALGKYPGVYDISDSFRAGKQEIRLAITPEAEAMGLTLADLARQVRQAFFGEEAQRIQRGRDDVRVMVRFPEDDRKSLETLESMRIRTPDGTEVPFSVVGRMEMGRGFATITRKDRNRTVNVTADVDIETTNANEVIADVEATILPQLLNDYRGLTYSLEGEQQQQRETLSGLGQSFLFALVVIYALLAVPFRSYLQPMIVMAAIPFGIIGAIWGHIALGMNLTVMSGFGIVALTGVVVNDSLVLVDFVNRSRRGGMSLFEAIRYAGEKRFRPIVLTSLTTFVGLTPLLLEKSMQAQFLIPMAISLAFGVLFATGIILILVPVGYLVIEDLKALGLGFWRWLWSDKRTEDEGLSPAT